VVLQNWNSHPPEPMPRGGLQVLNRHCQGFWCSAMRGQASLEQLQPQLAEPELLLWYLTIWAGPQWQEQLEFLKGPKAEAALQVLLQPEYRPQLAALLN